MKDRWLSPRIAAGIFLTLVGVALAAPHTARAAVVGPEADKFIPADADAVILIDVRQLVDSPAFQKYGKTDAIQGLQNPLVRALLDALGLDPLKDVDSLLLASSGDVMADNPRVLLVVRGQFDVDRIRLAARLYAAEHPADLTVGEADGQTIYEGKGDGKQPFYAVLPPDGTTLLASTDKAYLLQAVTNRSSGPSKELQDALGTIDGKEAVWMAALATDAMRKVMEAAPQGLRNLAARSWRCR